eukprot:721073-Prorocentrum_minimum.AAC.1
MYKSLIPWAKLPPSAANPPPSEVSFVDNLVGWVVGSGGSIVKTTNSGGGWTLQPSGTTAQLTAVQAISAREAWAVGVLGTALYTSDGGASWTLASPATEASAMLLGLFFFDINR